jgi:sulfite dehydrogenase (cytochrome) subunit B
MNGGGLWWLSIASAILVVLAAGAAFAGEQGVQLREARGRDVTTAFCATCHSLDYIEMNADVFDRPGWEKSVRKMIDRFGAPIPEEHARTIIAYLAENY